MRTTLTLDKDVFVKLQAEMRRSGRSFKALVNDCLRLALNTPPPARAGKRFKVKARPLGLRPGLSYDNIGDLLEQLEGPAHR